MSIHKTTPDMQAVPASTSTKDAPVPFSNRAFLEHFPANRRSTISNWFHYSVRSGANSPEAVLRAVRLTCALRQQRGRNLDAEMVLEAFRQDPDRAAIYAQHVIDYEALPRDARQQVKAERALHFVTQSMIGKDATGPQLALLRALGHRGAPPSDRAEASTLIDRLRQGKGQS